ncbi:hypothetical protein, partial [Cryobacterium sp. 10C2]|uniref:hypothetical protein n=1 Tax=Cryobacterium sp. 10C2 TaxID=3048576 RepID=UPI002AB47E7B
RAKASCLLDIWSLFQHPITNSEQTHGMDYLITPNCPKCDEPMLAVDDNWWCVDCPKAVRPDE